MNKMTAIIIEEWETEPDELKFEHEGLKCLILRMESLGHLCGYVGVKEYPQGFDEYEIAVHGGVTFNKPIETCSSEMKDYFEDCKYVIGFDAAHAGDLTPYGESRFRDMFGGAY